MRVTNLMLTNNLLRNMWSNMERLAECQDRLSSGKEIRRPSDDPVRITASLSLRSNIGETEQYDKNVGDAKTWMEVTDDALAAATEVLQTVRERAVAGANGTLPQASLDAIAQEVAQLRDQMMQIANTDLGGRYIFGGTKTDGEPFKDNGAGTIVYNGNHGDIMYEISSNVSVVVNFNGEEVFGDGTQDVFSVLKELETYLGGGENANISAAIGKIDSLIDNLIAKRGELGARENRMEMSADRLSQLELLQTDLLSRAEDADVAEAIIDLKNQENAYRTTLAAGARIIMPSLIDFLS